MLLQQIREMFGQRKAAMTNAYDQLVDDIANGKPLPADAVDIAVAAGKSMIDLEADVSMLLSKSHADYQLMRADDLQVEYDRLTDVFNKATEVRDAVVKRHKTELAEAEAKMNEAFSRRRSVGSEAEVCRRNATAVLNGTAPPDTVQHFAAMESERRSK